MTAMTIVEMLEINARHFPGKTAVIHKEHRITYEEFHKKSNALANFLIGIGLKKGERVGLLLKKTPEAIISFLGVAKAGGVIFPIDYNQTLASIQLILNLTRPCVLIIASEFQDLLSRLKLPWKNRSSGQ